MAQHFDLEEQEQLEQLKHFWNTWGTPITAVLVVIMGALAAWNGYQYWQVRQARQATALMEAVDQAVAQGDATRLVQAFGDLRKGYGGTVQAAQAGLAVAQWQARSEKWNEVQEALTWVAEHASDEGYQAVARLRLAGVLAEQKNYDGALAQLAGSFPAAFAGAVADRRGDVLQLQDKKSEAVAEYRKAYQALDANLDYRQLVQAKLGALGVAVQAAAQPGGAS